ncbi:sigma-70 family RNA polymerase sigma factor [Streptomyces griseoaurantiacus]|uniref:sigma-70 family RNA polymerase sigma factor n=2 Tax=Streptomyces TaxID=1883 RepID=UPI00345FBBFF
MSVDHGGEGTPPSPAAPSSGASPVPPADAELIGRMRDGDDSAYEELFRRHSGAVRRYARTCCRDAHTADDLTAEVFARMLQAVRGGSGPAHAVRPYLLTTVRRVAARWTASARREQLVEDFAVFAAQASASARRYPGREAPGDTAGPGAGSFGVDTELGADVRAMHAAEQSLAVRAFRSLPERWQAVLWHTEVEDESPSEVAVLFGLDANGTRVLASRAREGLRQAYLQAHVSESLAGDEVCARYAGQLGAHVRGRLRTRAERGVRKHLEQCARCRVAAAQIGEVAGGIPALVPVAVLGWFGAAGYGKVAGLLAGGGAAGAAAGAGASAGAGGGTGAAASEGLGAPVKAGVAMGVVAAAVAAVALALMGGGGPEKKDAAPPPRAPGVESVVPAPAASSGAERGTPREPSGPVPSAGTPRAPRASAPPAAETSAPVARAVPGRTPPVRRTSAPTVVPSAPPSSAPDAPPGTEVPSAPPSRAVSVRLEWGGVLGVEVEVGALCPAPAAPVRPAGPVVPAAPALPGPHTFVPGDAGFVSQVRVGCEGSPGLPRRR